MGFATSTAATAVEWLTNAQTWVKFLKIKWRLKSVGKENSIVKVLRKFNLKF